MLIKFTGDYTGGRKAITIMGYTFDGYEPTQVASKDTARFISHPEFETVEAPKAKKAAK